ncbi:MAG: DUF349 domain-containing protein, partial [Thermomicrobiales bacterium]
MNEANDEVTDAVAEVEAVASETVEEAVADITETTDEVVDEVVAEAAAPEPTIEEAAPEAVAVDDETASEPAAAVEDVAPETVEAVVEAAGEPAAEEVATEAGAVVEEPAVAAEEQSTESNEGVEATAETPAAPPEPPKPLDIETITRRTTTLEKDAETAEHKVSLLSRLTVLQEALNDLEATEDRAVLDARLAAVQSSIAAQSQERADAKDVIVIRSETLIESNEWKATSEAFREMQEQLRAIGAAGKELDDPIWERFRAARSGFHERRTAFFAERQKVWEESKVKKETLTVEAEALAEVDDFKDKSSRARTMMDEWKAAGFAGREAEDSLWPRFRGSLDKFYERRGAFYEENKAKKEALVVQAEEVAESTDWKSTSDSLRALMEEWKTLGSAGRENDDPLWTRFRGAQQKFYDGRSSAFAEREVSHKENVRVKEELCEQAEAIALREDMRGAIQDVIALQASWKTVGFIPREKSDELWQRFKRACDGVFSHVDTDRQDRVKTREQGTQDAASRKREQYQRLNESIAHDQANINRWRDTISSLGGGGRADQIRDELENRVIEVLDRVRVKQQRVEELQNDLQTLDTTQA